MHGNNEIVDLLGEWKQVYCSFLFVFSTLQRSLSVHLFVCSFVTLFFSKSTNFFLFLDTGQEVKVPRVSKVTEHICLGKIQILAKILKRSKMALKQGYGQKFKIAVDQSNLSILWTSISQEWICLALGFFGSR